MPNTPAPTSVGIRFVNTNGRRIVARDTGRFAWITGGRRWRYLRLLKRIAPSVICAQEWDEQMLAWLQPRLGLDVYKPTDGNRPVLWDRDKWRRIDGRWIELSRRNFAHAARLESRVVPGVRIWWVSIHLQTDATIRKAQISKLGAWVGKLPGACVVAGDWNQSTAALPGFAQATVGAKVTNRRANSLHGWRRQRYEGKWIDHVLVRGVESRYVDLILTSDLDESDHSILRVGLTGHRTPDPTL